MPMVLELPIAMLACARIGAIHSIVVTIYTHLLYSNTVQSSEYQSSHNANEFLSSELIFSLLDFHQMHWPIVLMIAKLG